MKKLLLFFALSAITTTALFSQVFDSLGVMSLDYNIEDITKKGDNLFAALGEGGVWYSSDEGFTWTQTTQFPDAGFGQEAANSIHVASNGDLIIGGNLNYNGAPLSGVVFRSSDDGETWSFEAYTGTTGYEKSGKIVELSNGDLMMRGGQDKLFTSSVSTTAWTQSLAPGGVIFGFECINEEIFVVTNPSAGNAGTWVTNDLGQTWALYGGNGTPVSQGTVTIAPILEADDYKFIGIGGTYDQKGVFKSGINDTLWVESNNGISSSGIYPICMATDNTTIWMVYQSTGGGCKFTSTTDFAENWNTPVEGLPQQGVGGPCIKKMLVFKSHLYTFANNSVYRIEDVAIALSTGNIHEREISMNLFPNPTKNVLNVTLMNSEKSSQWEILNAVGQSMMKGQTSSNDKAINMNVANLPVGYYIFKINMEGATLTRKFMKK